MIQISAVVAQILSLPAATTAKVAAMCDAHFEKARNIHRLARYFRDKASETEWDEFVEMMRRTAGELDELADSLERRRAAAAARPAGERPRLPERPGASAHHLHHPRKRG
jgi:hypothetical protein